MRSSEEIMGYLGGCKPYPESEEAKESDKKTDAKEKRIRIIGIILFVPAVFLIFLVKQRSFPWWFSSSVDAFTLISVLVLVTSVLVWPATLLNDLKRPNVTKYEVKVETYMKSLAGPLMTCTSKQLKYVDDRLAERYEDLHTRLAIVFGGSIVKTSVLALVLAFFGQLGKILDQAHKMGFVFRPWLLVGVGVLGFFFFVVVPFSIKIAALRYPFQRRLIKVALDLKELTE